MQRPPDPAAWRRARAVFDEVIMLPPSVRANRLDVLCADDPALRAEVESLLGHDSGSKDGLSSMVGEAATAALAAAPELAAGDTLLHYTLSAKVGQGGMGVVWRASDRTLAREVAIKVLPSLLARDHALLARLEREARLLAALNHSAIAAIYGLHEVGGIRFLAMEFVDGRDLTARIAQGALPVAQVLDIARQVADALEEAHDKGIVHRDLKPANIKLRPDGRVKVLDFGLAKALDADAASGAGARPAAGDPSLVTGVGLILGTAAYMAPEQARGLAVDKRGDIWAFGVLLFEMLSGRRPFAGATTTDVLAAVVTAEPDWRLLPATTPPDLVRLVRRCLEKDARRRLRDIGDARLELDAMIAGTSDASSGPSAPPAIPSARRRRVRDAALVAAGAVAALAAGLAIWLGQPVPPAPVLRLNVALQPGTRLEDVREAGRQTLAFSRDGEQLAFVVRASSGRTEIQIRRLSEVAPRPVAGTEGGDMPFFSPDGAWLGFAADGKLKRVSLAGGQPAVICDAAEPRGAVWLDDGTIVFAPAVFGGLFRVNPTGGAPVPVTTVDAARERGHRWPIAVQDSTAVLFNADLLGPTDRERAIDLVVLATGERRRVLAAASYPRLLDGQLLFGRDDQLLAVPFDAARPSASAEPRVVLDDVRMDLGATGRVFADVSASGALAFVPGSSRAAQRTLVWLDRRGAATSATPEPRPYRGARLSPDGRLVAVIIDAPPSSLWTHDLARGTWLRLTSSAAVTTPAWTPDGARLLFALSTPSGPVLHWVAADGSDQPTRLTPPSFEGGDMPTVSPDSRTALFAVQDSRGDDIYALALDPVGVPSLFQGATGNEGSPAVSPSGRFVAFSSTQSGRREVYLRPMGGPARLWPVSSGGGTAPRWRADERELFYVSGTRMMAVAIDPRGDRPAIGTPQPLFEEPALAWSGADLFRYDVTADGQRFITVKPDAGEDAPLQLVVVPRFADELRARQRRAAPSR